MSDTPRRPTAFSLQPDPVRPPEDRRTPASFGDGVVLTPDADDPFADTTLGPAAASGAVVSALQERRARRRFSLAKLGFSALGVLVSLALGLWIDSLVRDLFSRNDALGYTAIGAAAIVVLAVLGIIGREVLGLMRLNAVQALKDEVAAASLPTAGPKAARKSMADLVHHLATRPETARGRERLKATEGEIIDGPHLIDLTERELLLPLDRQARALILNASKRVSVVTAVSPRALVDLGYVVFESARLIRAMADLYGGRPGTLGLIRLIRDVLAHLAVTGSIAVGDGLVQQVLGHGIASRLSARLGEGVVNGLMTARIGIAAMDLCRPMPFRALKRPGIGDFIGDLTPGQSKPENDRG